MCVHRAKMYLRCEENPAPPPSPAAPWAEETRCTDSHQQGGDCWVLALLGGSFLFPGSGKSLPRGGEWLRWRWKHAISREYESFSDLPFLEFFSSFLAFSLVQPFLLTSHSTVWFLSLKHHRELGGLRPASCAMPVPSAAEEASESCCRVSGKFCRAALLGSWCNQSWPPPFSNCWKVVGMSFPKWGTCFRYNPGLRINRLGFFKTHRALCCLYSTGHV